MARRSFASTFANIAIVTVAAGTVVGGSVLARFAFAMQDGSLIEPRLAESYSYVWGLRGSSRRFLAPADRFEAVTSDPIANVLAIQPTNGLYWLALADALQAEGGARARIRDALQMSEVTAPHEATTMGRRAAFIVRLWEESSDVERRLAIGHLAELGVGLPAKDRDRIREIIAAKSEDSRAAIRNALLATTQGDSGLLRQFGL